MSATTLKLGFVFIVCVIMYQFTVWGERTKAGFFIGMIISGILLLMLGVNQITVKYKKSKSIKA